MNPRKKIYLWLFIFIIISLFFLVFLIPKFLREIRAKSQELISLKNELASFQKEVESFEKLAKIYQNYQPNLEKIDKIFIDPKEPIDFFKFLEENANHFQLEYKISPLPGKEEEKSLSFQISVSGSFNNFLKFLERIENSPYLIDVLDLNVKKTIKKEVPESIIEANFSIKVYTK
jgi:Tfp pilus assembly protein PilO